MSGSTWSRREALRVAAWALIAAAPRAGVPAATIPRPTARARVGDEFGRLRRVIVHDGANAIDVDAVMIRTRIDPAALREHPETGPVDRRRLIAQVGRLRELLLEAGVGLIRPAEVPGAYCQVFTRDPCFVIGETLFLGALRDRHRADELRGLDDLIASMPGPVVDLAAPGALIEGGDVLVLDGGALVLVGTNRHTNAAGIARLEAALDPAGTGRKVVRVPHRGLHLDCCLAPLPGGDALVDPARVPADSIELLRPYFGRLLPIEPVESARQLAANLLWLDERTVATNAAAVRTNALLRSLGYDVRPLAISELVNAWGGLRCVTCPLEREPIAAAAPR